MTTYALVKDGITQNVIRLIPGTRYTPPEGMELVPYDEAPVFGTIYAKYFPIAEDRSGAIDIDDRPYIELTRVEDTEEISDLISTVINPDEYALASKFGVIAFKRSEPQAYIRHTAIKPEHRGEGHASAIVRAGVRWMFLHTDAKIIGGSMGGMDNTAIVAASNNVPGVIISNKGKVATAVFTIGRFASAYGVDKFLNEMRLAGQPDKADRLESMWSAD